MAVDTQAHLKLQVEQLKKNNRQADTEIARLTEREATVRRMVLELGQALVPEALAAIPSAATADGWFAPPVKGMETEALIRLIQGALSDKLRRLTAFGVGITPEQRERFLARIAETDVADWVNDPALAELQRQLDTAMRMQREAEARERTLRTQLDAANAAAGTQSSKLLRAQSDAQDLARQLEDAQKRILQLTTADTAEAVSVESQVSAPIPSQQTATQEPVVTATAPAKKYMKTVEDSFPVLVMILATRGLCERPRLAEMLTAPEFELSADPNNFLINGAFDRADEMELIQQITPRNETGVGRVPNLVRLTEAGRTYARTALSVEPVPSELDRLLKLHDTIEHVALILQTRKLFADKYPEPIASIDLFPEPIQVEEDKRSEPDLIVTLASGKTLLIECERDTQKNPGQRADKWHKCWLAGHGEIYVVCPDASTVQTIGGEIGLWRARHGGSLRLRVTSIYQVVVKGSKFWSFERDL